MATLKNLLVEGGRPLDALALLGEELGLLLALKDTFKDGPGASTLLGVDPAAGISIPASQIVAEAAQLWATADAPDEALACAEAAARWWPENVDAIQLQADVLRNQLIAGEEVAPALAEALIAISALMLDARARFDLLKEAAEFLLVDVGDTDRVQEVLEDALDAASEVEDFDDAFFDTVTTVESQLRAIADGGIDPGTTTDSATQLFDVYPRDAFALQADQIYVDPVHADQVYVDPAHADQVYVDPAHTDQVHGDPAHTEESQKETVEHAYFEPEADAQDQGARTQEISAESQAQLVEAGEPTSETQVRTIRALPAVTPAEIQQKRALEDDAYKPPNPRTSG